MNKFLNNLASATAIAVVLSSAMSLNVLAKSDFERFAEKPGDTLSDLGRQIDEKVTRPIVDTVKKTADDAGQITNAIVQGQKALTGATILEEMLKGGSLDAALQKSLEDGKNMVRGYAAIPGLNNNQLYLYHQIANNVAGPDAGKVVGYVVLPKAIENTLPSVLADKTIKLTEHPKEATEELVGVPLNAALQQAYEYYKDKGAPLPAKTYNLLSHQFPKEHLDTVRYVIDDSGPTMPALINAVRTQIGEKTPDNFAVTVDNIIVFAKQPADGRDNIFLWAHEVQHTVQYKQKGMDGFAAEYTTQFRVMEDEADRVAAELVQKINAFVASLQ